MNRLYSIITLLLVVQLAELLASFEVLVIGSSSTKVAWILFSAAISGSFSLFLASKALQARHADRILEIAKNVNDGLLFVRGQDILFANFAARKLLDTRSSGFAIPPEVSLVLGEARRNRKPVLFEPQLSGRRARYLVSRVELPNEQPPFEESVYVFRDLTFLKESEEAKINFIGVLSHEIKTPITSLVMALGMLERVGWDSELLRIANADVARLRVLVEDLLKISKLKILADPASLPDVSRTLLDKFNLHASAKRAATSEGTCIHEANLIG